jgi:hypothetical protein
MFGEVWERVEEPYKSTMDSSTLNSPTNKYIHTQSTTTPYGSIPVVSYTFDAASGMGELSVDITGRGIEVRDWIIKNVGKICSNQNIRLEAGKEPTTGGRYQILKESVKDNILTIEFKALY